MCDDIGCYVMTCDTKYSASLSEALPTATAPLLSQLSKFNFRLGRESVQTGSPHHRNAPMSDNSIKGLALEFSDTINRIGELQGLLEMGLDHTALHTDRETRKLQLLVSSYLKLVEPLLQAQTAFLEDIIKTKP